MSEQFDKIVKVLDAKIDAPVPPAGDVEVQRYSVSAWANNTMSWGEPCTVAELSVKKSQEGEWVKWEDHRAHVTRLLEENTLLRNRLAIYEEV